MCQVYKDKLVGYKPKNADYSKAVSSVILNHVGEEFEINDGVVAFKVGSKYEKLFKKLDVLDIWFDKVYENVKKEYTLDDFVTQNASNQWYIHKAHINSLVYHQGKGKGFGIKADGTWSTNIEMDISDKTWFPAKQVYISNRLRVIAESKGIVTGTYYSDGFGIRKVKSGYYNVLSRSWYAKLVNDKAINVLDLETGEWLLPMKISDNQWYKKHGSNTLFKHSSDGYGVLLNESGATKYVNEKLDLFVRNPYQWQKIGNPFDFMLKIARKKYPHLKIKVAKYDQEKLNMSMLEPIHGMPICKLMVDGKWVDNPTTKSKLPIINGVEGRFDENNVEDGGQIIYGECAKLRPEWFLSSQSREIKEMTLSSGVKINEQQMNQIREVLLDSPKFLEGLKIYNKRHGSISMMGRENKRKINYYENS